MSLTEKVGGPSRVRNRQSRHPGGGRRQLGPECGAWLDEGKVTGGQRGRARPGKAQRPL